MKNFAQLAASFSLKCLALANPINFAKKAMARRNLGHAVNRNWPDVVQKSCDILGQDAGKAAHENGAPWITLAAGRGHIECLEILLRSGADPCSREMDGTSALAVASEHGHFQCVEALISAGADPNALNLAGESALGRLANTFGRWGKGGQVDYVRCVQALAASGADLDHCHSGCTPLRMSAELGSSDIAIALLDAGAIFEPGSATPAATAAYGCAKSNGQNDCARDLFAYHNMCQEKAALSALVAEQAPKPSTRRRL